MVTGVLIDSNFYIRHFRSGKNPFQELAAAAGSWELFTCGMVMLEVLRGVRIPRHRVQFEVAFSLMNFIPTSKPVWTKARQLAWELDRNDLILPARDHLVAACALQADIPLLTADAHFRRVPGLTVLDRLLP